MKLTRILLSASMVFAGTFMAGCEDQRAAIVQAYPQIAPVLGGRPKPSPFELRTGNVTGFVYGASGKSQPIPLATNAAFTNRIAPTTYRRCSAGKSGWPGPLSSRMLASLPTLTYRSPSAAHSSKNRR